MRGRIWGVTKRNGKPYFRFELVIDSIGSSKTERVWGVLRVWRDL